MGCDQQYQGQNLSYSQIEALWVQNGGSQAMAPLMAAIAMAESGGNSGIANTCDNNGTQTSWGLWQISTGTHDTPAPNWSDPNVNAQLAMQKLNSQGLGAWGTYTSGAYQSYLNSNGGSLPANLAAATHQTPGGPSGAGPIQEGSPNKSKCTFKITWPSAGPLGGGSTCFWYDSWTHGLLGVVAIGGGGVVLLAGLGILLGSSKAGDRARSLVSGMVPGGGAMSQQAQESEEEKVRRSEDQRQYRQQIRQQYRDSKNPPLSDEQKAIQGEERRQKRRQAVQAWRDQHGTSGKGGSKSKGGVKAEAGEAAEVAAV